MTVGEAWIIDAVRSPRGIGKQGKGSLAGIHPQRVLAQVLDGLRERVGFDPADVDDVTTELTAEDLQQLVESYKSIVREHAGRDFPQEAWLQLRDSVLAVFRSWNNDRATHYRNMHGYAHDWGTAVNVQTMVFGNRDDNSGTGVGFTRNAATGENKPYGDFLVNAQGEDVVAGIRNTEDLDHMKKHFPVIHADLLEIFKRLEEHYTDMCDTEFTIEQGKLWMLQTRVGKRTGAAALKMAVDMTKGTGTGSHRWKISREEALMRVSAEHLDAVLHPHFAGKGVVLAKGLGASPGAAGVTIAS